MDTNTLVNELVEDGKKIVEQLSRDGFEVTAAFWLKAAEDGEWYFYIASPVAEVERLSDAYRKLYSIIRRMPEPHWIDPLEVKLIGSNNPIAKDVLDIHKRFGGLNVSPIRWGGKELGNVRVEEALLYPLPATAPVSSA